MSATPKKPISSKSTTKKISSQSNLKDPTRLSLKPSVVKRLFGLSGNLCAFPNCSNNMILEDGTVLGEICHIEAAEEGGERYNEKQTPEDRRRFENLILLCPTHHVTTNNVTTFTTDKLKEMKENHEKRFSENTYKISATSIDSAIENYRNYTFNKYSISTKKAVLKSVGNIDNSIVEINNYYPINKKKHYDSPKEEKKNYDIITDIFDYIINTRVNETVSELIQNSTRHLNLKTKILLNFPLHQADRVRGMLLNTVKHRTLIERHLQSISAIDPMKIDELRECIQEDYCKLRDCANTNTAIDNFEIINQMAEKYLPNTKSKNVQYRTSSKAIVLYYFDICDLGKQTINESSQLSLF